MTDKKFEKSFNLKKVIAEIIEPKIPVIFITILMLFIFYLVGLFSLFSSILFGSVFIAFLLAIQDPEQSYYFEETPDREYFGASKKLNDTNYLEILSDGIKLLPDSIFIIDSNETIVAANKKGNQEFRTSDNLETVVGLRLPNLIRSTPLSDCVKDIRLLKNSKKIEIILPGQIEKSYDIFLSKISSAVKGEFNIMILFRETTDLKKSINLRSDFIANASHELKTPIAIIKGIAETLDRYGADDLANSKLFLSKLLNESDRAQSLIEDLLSLNQLEMRQHLLPDIKINLVLIIDSIFDGLSDMAKKQKITLKRTIRKKRYLMLGDEKDIKKALINLIENAIKYNRENGEVNISLEDNDRQILLIVEDSGLGIPPGDISRLTDRFYRVDVPASMAVGGTGLGLAIVKNTVIRHNGTLEISSELGKGSSFKLIFNKF